QAERAKEKLPPAIQEAIEDKLELAENVHEVRHERLKGLPYFSLHFGQYRIAYQVDHSQRQIHVCDLGKHDEVYRRLMRR
ncbi:MAG: type II toxin-antitoxin system RelE/ParE family toxin, partial [Armatimonadota bacterium]|nr:type II toxin-antitoxin system RelE/ParE family toxin [Armatimonadota bacterium]